VFFFRELLLNSAIVEDAGDTRHQVCSCIVIPQSPDNAVDPASSCSNPEGSIVLKKYDRIFHIICPHIGEPVFIEKKFKLQEIIKYIAIFDNN